MLERPILLVSAEDRVGRGGYLNGSATAWVHSIPERPQLPESSRAPFRCGTNRLFLQLRPLLHRPAGLWPGVRGFGHCAVAPAPLRLGQRPGHPWVRDVFGMRTLEAPAAGLPLLTAGTIGVFYPQVLGPPGTALLDRRPSAATLGPGTPCLPWLRLAWPSVTPPSALARTGRSRAVPICLVPRSGVPAAHPGLPACLGSSGPRWLVTA
jgi:hypothetical protein